MTIESSSGTSESWASTPNRKSVAVLALEDLEASLLLNPKSVDESFMAGVKFAMEVVIAAEKKCR